jgi:hypothetical protein
MSFVRKLLSFVILFSLVSPIPAFAANPGGKCKKIGALSTSKVKGKVKPLICVRVGKKNVWAITTTTTTSTTSTTTSTTTTIPASCATGSACVIGDKGPGGGIVFYVAEPRQNWGKYLEAAPSGWASTPSELALPQSDPRLSWCNVTTKVILSGTLPEVGAGKANTKEMINACSSGAGNLAASYRGGKLNDWYLPSLEEVRILYTQLFLQGLGGMSRNGNYWSSTEDDSRNAFSFDMSAGGAYSLGGMKDSVGNYWMTKAFSFFVRPVRAFG